MYAKISVYTMIFLSEDVACRERKRERERGGGGGEGEREGGRDGRSEERNAHK